MKRQTQLPATFAAFSWKQQEPWVVSVRMLNRALTHLPWTVLDHSLLPEDTRLESTVNVQRLRWVSSVRQILAVLGAALDAEASRLRLSPLTPEIWFKLSQSPNFPEEFTTHVQKQLKAYYAAYNRGIGYSHGYNFPAAVAEFEKAAKLAYDCGLMAHYWGALEYKGESLQQLGRYAEALEIHRQCSTGLEEDLPNHEGKPGEEAVNALLQAYYNTGACLHRVLRLEESITQHQATIALIKKRFPRHPEALSWRLRASFGAANASLSLGRKDTAKPIYIDAYETAKNAGIHLEMAQAATHLSEIYKAEGDYEKGLAFSLESITTLRHLGVPSEGIGLKNAAECFVKLKRFAEAKSTLRQYHPSIARQVDPNILKRETELISDLHRECNDLDGATLLWASALTSATKIRDVQFQKRSLNELCRLAQQMKNKAQLDKYLKEAKSRNIRLDDDFYRSE